MIITAAAVGTRGDVAPLVEVGEEMIKRGHTFRILTHEAFRPLVEAKGVTYKKLDTDADHVMQYLVMCGTCSAFAYHAAEYLHIPCARLFYSPMDPTRQYSLYSDAYDSDEVLKSYGVFGTEKSSLLIIPQAQC